MKSFLLSSLKRQAASAAGFLELHPNDWLVWEVGSWKAAWAGLGRGGREQAQTVALDVDLSAKVPANTKATEALAIAIPDAQRLRLGRAPETDISIGDSTLSSTHLTLARSPEGLWLVEDFGSTNGTTVEGVAVRAGERVPLRDGAKIVAGKVTLTFHTTEGMLSRLGR